LKLLKLDVFVAKVDGRMSSSSPLYYAAMLLLLVVVVLALNGQCSAGVSSVAQSDTSAGRCEKITIPLCTGMKYNMTRMPNLVGIANQRDAALQVNNLSHRSRSGHVLEFNVV